MVSKSLECIENICQLITAFQNHIMRSLVVVVTYLFRLGNMAHTKSYRLVGYDVCAESDSPSGEPISRCMYE